MKYTMMVLVGVAVLLGLFDIYTAIANGTETTISWVLYKYSQNYPTIPLVIGFVMGHIFGSMSGAGPIQALMSKFKK